MINVARGSRSAAQVAAEEHFKDETEELEPYVRPKAPHGIPVRVCRLFNQIVNSAPDYYLLEHDVPMILSYCRQLIMLEDLQNELVDDPSKSYYTNPKGFQETSPMAKREMNLAESVRRTAIALRIPPTARFSLVTSSQKATQTVAKSTSVKNKDEDDKPVAEVFDLSEGR